MSLIKDEQQSADNQQNKHAGGNVPGGRERSTQSGRQSEDVRATKQSTKQSNGSKQPNGESNRPDELNGTQLANRRQPLLNKFRCDCCFGGKACAGCRSGSRKASHSSVHSSTSHAAESTHLESHLSSPHLACPSDGDPDDCKDDCKLIKLADNRLPNGVLPNGQSNERPYDQRTACLSTERLISETNLSETDNLTSSPGNRPVDRRASPSPATNPVTNSTSPSPHRHNHAHLSNSPNLLSNKLTSCSSSPDQANSRGSPERLTLELVQKSSTCSSKSFRSIRSIEVRDDLSVTGDPRGEKAPDTGSVESPTKLNTTRSHFNYPRKLRNKLNASIHGSRSVRFHTKALFTTLTILGTYLVCIMPALSKFSVNLLSEPFLIFSRILSLTTPN